MKSRGDSLPRTGSSVRFTERSTEAAPPEDAAQSSSRQALDWDGPRYQHVRELASGGMGTVHEVFDDFLSRTVAAKFVRADAVEPEEYAAAFLDEARTTALLEHPNVIPVHDLGFDAERGLYFCMRLVRGRTLQELITDTHRQPISRAGLRRVLSVVLRVCDAISFAHGRGVIHRDVKPENVLVGSHGQVYLTDWGIALLKNPDALREGEPGAGALQHPQWSSRGAFAGTVAYMAPEQAMARLEEIDERTDVYGIGGILHFLLTGKAPHEDSNIVRALEHSRTGAVHPFTEHPAWPDLPPGLMELTLKALAPNPANRYQTAADLAEDLGLFLDGGGWFATREFPPGAVIVAEGEYGESAYIVVEGTCTVTKRVAGQDSFLRSLKAGDVFGEAAALSTRVRTATVTAEGRVLVKVVTREALESELAASPWLGAFVKALAERFVELDKKSGG
jgi:serine/threonine-protein kinase